MSGDVLALGAVVVLIAANAFFVAAEFAFVAVDRTRLERLAADGNRRARIVVGLLRRLSYELSGAQLGITLTSLVLGFLAEPAVGAQIEPLIERAGLSADLSVAVSVAIALTLATVVQMVVGELVPKNLAVAKPLPTALWVGPPFRLTTLVARPLILFLNGAANATVRRMGIEPQEELVQVRSLEELGMLIESSGEHGTLRADETQLLARALRFGDKTAADALSPRTAVTALTRDATLADLVATAKSTGFSRFPVQGEDLDDIVGVVHVKSALRVPADERTSVPVDRVLTEPVVIPESLPLDDLLVRMRAGRSQLAIVIDEFGGTAGIITLEDLLEELVGDIRDEYDTSSLPSRLTVPWQSGTWVAEGALHRDEVRDLCDLELPEGRFETLAGYLLVLFDRVPDVGDIITDAAGWRFEVLERDRLRVALVRVTAPPVLDEEGLR